LFATHYEYVWLASTGNPFRATADWNLDQRHPQDPNAARGLIDTSFAKGAVFAQWLGAVNALATTNPPRIDMNISRHDMDRCPILRAPALWLPAQRWISVDPIRPDGSPFPTSFVERQNGQNVTRQIPNYIGAPQHYTFNTPSAPRPLSSAGACCSAISTFRTPPLTAHLSEQVQQHCATPQEKVIEFMLFDLAIASLRMLLRRAARQDLRALGAVWRSAG